MLPIPKTSRLSQTRLNKFKVVFKQPNKRRNLLEHEPLYQPPRICPEQHRSTERRMNTRNACARLHMPKIGWRVAGHLPVAPPLEKKLLLLPPAENARRIAATIQLLPPPAPSQRLTRIDPVRVVVDRISDPSRPVTRTRTGAYPKTMHVAFANQPITDNQWNFTRRRSAQPPWRHG
jgi:hypothetical protein